MRAQRAHVVFRAMDEARFADAHQPANHFQQRARLLRWRQWQPAAVFADRPEQASPLASP